MFGVQGRSGISSKPARRAQVTQSTCDASFSWLLTMLLPAIRLSSTTHNPSQAVSIDSMLGLVFALRDIKSRHMSTTAHSVHSESPISHAGPPVWGRITNDPFGDPEENFHMGDGVLIQMATLNINKGRRIG